MVKIGPEMTENPEIVSILWTVHKHPRALIDLPKNRSLHVTNHFGITKLKNDWQQKPHGLSKFVGKTGIVPSH